MIKNECSFLYHNNFFVKKICCSIFNLKRLPFNLIFTSNQTLSSNMRNFS